jgi:hypothetical protein
MANAGVKRERSGMSKSIFATQNKYRNTPTTVDGITFASKREADRYVQLRLFEKCGIISNLELQKRFVIVPKSEHGKALFYICDFCYTKDGKTVVEDAKGVRTAIYRLKKRLVQEMHGIIIQEV